MAIFELQNFYKTKIKIACGAGTGNIYLDVKPTPINGILVISPGSEALREIIKYTGTGTDGNGDYVTIANIADRGLGGTTAQAHAVGEAVRMNYTAEHQQEIDDTINAIVAAGAPNATTTVNGLSRLSTAPANPAIPIAVSVTDTALIKTAKQNDFLLDITGMVLPYAGASAPTGFLLCDGAAVSRSTYADLFALISTTYGVGDGSTTFNLPNLKGRVPVGLDTAQSEFDVLGETGGAKTHTLTIAQIPAHNHQNLWGIGSQSGGNRLQSGNYNPVGNTTPTADTGGGEAHPNLQPYIVLNYIIKT